MHLDAVAEDAGDTVDDGQPESDATALGSAPGVQLVELEEDRLQLVGGDAPASVPHLQAYLAATPARPQQHAAALGVAAGVAEQVAQDPRQQARIGAHCQSRDPRTQGQAGGTRDFLELRGQRSEQFVEGIVVQVRTDRALVEPGDFQQVGEQGLGTFQGQVGALHQLQFGGRQAPFAQGVDQQPRRVERLQQVVAGGGEVLVLAVVGGFGGVARLAQLAVELFQLVGALGYPPLQLLVHGLQALLGLDPLGDVGDETFDQFFLVVPEQQVHQYLDVTAVPAPEARLVAEQAAALAQQRADPSHLGLAADEQLPGHVLQRPEHLLRIVVAEHLRQRRIGGAQPLAEAGLEDAVHRVLEQPFVAVALGLQLLQARQQLRVVALARGVAAQAE